MKIKSIITLFTITLFLISNFGINIYAASCSVDKNILETTESVYKKYYDFKEIEINDKKEKSDDYIINKNIKEIDLQIENSNKNIEQLENGINSYSTSPEEIQQYRYQLEYQNIYKYELEISKCIYEMQDKLANLYSEYSDKIVTSQENKVKCETFKELYNIKNYEVQMEYLNCVVEQKKNEYSIINKSYKIGYATQSDVLTAKSSYKSVLSDFNVCKCKYEKAVFDFEKKTETKLIDMFHDFSSSDKYDSEFYIKKFKKDSFYKDYYDKQVQIYSELCNALKELMKTINSKYNQGGYKFLFKENEDYFNRFYDYFTNQVEYYDNEMEICSFNAEKYITDLELYVYEVCNTLNSLIYQRDAKIIEIESAEYNYDILSKMFDEGRINGLDLSEANVNIEKLYYDLFVIEMNIMYNDYVLELGVE